MSLTPIPTGASRSPGRRVRWWTLRPGRWLVAALAVAGTSSALLAAGCGGGSPGASVAQVGTTTTSKGHSSSSSGSGKGNPRAFAACMRRNGVPEFPDPDSTGHIKITGGQHSGGTFGLDAASPQFGKAAKACRRLQPNGGTQDPQEQAKMQQQALAFSRCMRAHGLPKFPDPDFQPNGRGKLTVGKDLNPNSPRFKVAQKACQNLVPGASFAGQPPKP